MVKNKETYILASAMLIAYSHKRGKELSKFWFIIFFKNTMTRLLLIAFLVHLGKKTILILPKTTWMAIFFYHCIAND